MRRTKTEIALRYVTRFCIAVAERQGSLKALPKRILNLGNPDDIFMRKRDSLFLICQGDRLLLGSLADSPGNTRSISSFKLKREVTFYP